MFESSLHIAFVFVYFLIVVHICVYFLNWRGESGIFLRWYRKVVHEFDQLRRFEPSLCQQKITISYESSKMHLLLCLFCITL